MNRPSKTPGICRIDQPAKYNHGFLCAGEPEGKNSSRIFCRQKAWWPGTGVRGGAGALPEAAEETGNAPATFRRRWWAEQVRRKGKSGIHGVRRVIIRGGRPATEILAGCLEPEVGAGEEETVFHPQAWRGKGEAAGHPRPASGRAEHEMNFSRQLSRAQNKIMSAASNDKLQLFLGR